MNAPWQRNKQKVVENPFDPAFSLPAYLGNAPTVFDLPVYDRLNEARLRHLDSLSLPIRGASILEVGAGVGRLSSYFIERQAELLATDVRPDNVAELLRRHPERQAVVANLETPGEHQRLGTFDIVFLYGVLYHVSDPARVIAELAACCTGFFLLETVVSHIDNTQVNPVPEAAHIPDQSVKGQGCRPGRDWLFTELKKHFACVRVPARQPNHPEFPLRWPAPREVEFPRAIFVAARTPLSSPHLLDHVPAAYQGAV